MTEPASWRQTKPPVPVFEDKVTLKPVVPLLNYYTVFFKEELVLLMCLQ